MRRFTDLPNEILLDIFLDAYDDGNTTVARYRPIYALIHTSVAQVATVAHFSTVRLVNNPSIIKFEEHLNAFPHLALYTKSIYIGIWSSIPLGTVVYILTLCANLDRANLHLSIPFTLPALLTITSCIIHTAIAFLPPRIGELLPNARELELELTRRVFGEANWDWHLGACDALTRLAIECFSSNKQEILRILFSVQDAKLENMLELSLKLWVEESEASEGCGRDTAEAALQIVRRGVHLRVFTLWLQKPQIEFVDVLEALPCLRELHICEPRGLRPVQRQYPLLRSLELLNTRREVTLAAKDFLGLFPSLEELLMEVHEDLHKELPQEVDILAACCRARDIKFEPQICNY